MTTLILLRHGESEWNQANRFAGWADIALTAHGIEQARRSGELLRDAGLLPQTVHTSLLRRTIHTAEVLLAACERTWIPIRRSWRLNERHYGALQGLNKVEVRHRHGDELFARWRRSYDAPPPALDPVAAAAQRNDPRYAALGFDPPTAESLRDVTARLLPYWTDVIGADLRAGHTTLVIGHSNSLRALIKHLDGLSDDAVVDVNVPTGVPLRYRIDPHTMTATGSPVYLDPEAAAAGIAIVTAQGGVTEPATG